MRNIPPLAIFACVLLAGCGAPTLLSLEPVDADSIDYQNGIPLWRSDQQNSTVFLSPENSLFREGERLGFMVRVENESANTIELDIDNVSASWTGAEKEYTIECDSVSKINCEKKIAAVYEIEIPLVVFSYASVVREIESEARSAAISNAISAFSSAIASSQPSTTTGTVYAPNGTTSSFVSTTHNPSQQAASSAAIQMQAQQRADRIQSNRERRLANADLILRRNTLSPGETLDSFFLIDIPGEYPSPVTVSIDIGKDRHVFSYHYRLVH